MWIGWNVKVKGKLHTLFEYEREEREEAVYMYVYIFGLLDYYSDTTTTFFNSKPSVLKLHMFSLEKARELKAFAEEHGANRPAYI